MATERERTLCVTGASGFLGSHCVKHALDNGFHVRATVRSAAKGAFLEKLDGAEERLTIIEGCDLLVDGSFDEAIQGCDTVLHTASPFFWAKTEEELVGPAVKGTENVLASCKKHDVKKVVLTSSTAAVYAVYGTKPADHVFSEADFTDPELVRAKKNWYCLSKINAELRAWELSKEEGCPYKLAVMNPALILGEMLQGQGHFNTSHEAILGLTKAEKIKKSCMHLVDVYDVAAAHVQAAKMPLSWGGWGERYLLVGESVMQATSVETMRASDKIPDDIKKGLPTELNDELSPSVLGAPSGSRTLFDTSRSTTEPSDASPKGLGLSGYVGLKDMLDTTINTLFAHGFTDLKMYTLGKS